jgi:predicted SAM-dependent methyltransferase/glycosyltransferase involved in cell wall biosynthesis
MKVSKKLHIGCGKNLIKGWTNADISGKVDLIIDARKKFTIIDSSVDYIFNEHFIEHITKKEAVNFLKECKRVLNIALRISTPNLDFLIECYHNRKLDEWENVGWVPKSTCDLMNEGMRFGPHEYVYNIHELKHILYEAGFKYIKECNWRESDIPEFRNLECRPYHNELIVEAYITTPKKVNIEKEEKVEIKQEVQGVTEEYEHKKSTFKLNPYRNGEIICNFSDLDMTPMVSICCMCHNYDKLIQDAIRGFLIQECNFPIEIIIHDDGSTDRTTEKLIKFQKNNPRIVKLILQKKNVFTKCGGVYPTAILAEHARGKYIAWCDGDDYWIDSLKLQKQVNFLEENLEWTACYTSWCNYNCKARKVDFVAFEKNLKDYTRKQLLAYNFTGENIAFSSLMHRNDYTEEQYEVFWADYALITMLGLHGGCKFIEGLQPSIFRCNYGGNTWQDQSVDVKRSKILEMHNRIYNYALSSKNKDFIEIQNLFRIKNNIPIIRKS